jgi:hypothetical protein
VLETAMENVYLFIYFINLWVPEIREVNESNIYIYIYIYIFSRQESLI